MNYLLIPIYNEKENIPNLIARIQTFIEKGEWHLVFSDDGSADGSIQVLQRQLERFPDIPYEILGDGTNRGPGAAFDAGFNHILQYDPAPSDIVITMEADNTSDIGILPQMMALSAMGYELVLASVYAQGGGFQKTSFFRKTLSFGANMVFRTVFDIKVLTLSSFYRIYHCGLLQRVKTSEGKLITENGFICMLELLLKCIKHKATVIEVPMVLRSTERIGRSKMKIWNTSKSYIRFLVKYRK